MSGQLCKYFLNDACRYGDKCRFVHDYDAYYNNKMSRNRFVYAPQQQPRRQLPQIPSQSQPQPKKQESSLAETIAYLAQEMKLIEKGKMWPFTILGILNRGNIPGWDDYSQEEMRWAYVTAVSNGTVQKYMQEYQSLLRKAAESRNLIMSPNKQTLDIIKNVFDKKIPKNVPQVSVFGSVFNNDPAPGLFKPKDPAPGLFSNVIKNNTNSFSFGQNSVFGNQPETPMMTSVFGQPINTIESQEMKDAFGKPPETPLNANIFGQVPQVFQTSTPFGANDNNLFKNIPHKSSQPQNKIYSKMEDLTELEIEQFKAQTFTSLNVPFKPPPKELCQI